MRLHITPGDGTPIYRQIMNQVKYLIAARRLSPGEELPSIRVLAQELVINPNTVARAYRELEAAGLIRSRHGSGTVVADRGSPLAQGEKDRILEERIGALLAEAAQLGYTLDELVSRVCAHHAEMQDHGEVEKGSDHD
ncbi:MAG: GntR family transcriptional regulator [Candidatus Hydrogenedentes bacterium]|nr:GntR family transcriptional regulator [Candidatus Hydrogenedentota bacterium]